MNVSKLFLERAKASPSRLAIIETKNAISYGELATEVKLTAAYFSSKGIGKGDRVMVFVPMSIDLYRVVLALFYLGAVAVFVDEWVSRERLALSCKLASCKGFIGIPKARFYALFLKELRKIPIKLRLNKRGSIAFPLAEVEGENTALVTFTTGSTGTPKAADRSHQFLLEQFKALEKLISPVPEDIDMTFLPIVLFINLGAGCTSVIPDAKLSKPNAFNPEKILVQLRNLKVNRIIASPYFVKRISEFKLVNPEEIDFVDQIYTGGAPVFPAVASLFLKAFPKAKANLIYGSTEAEPISAISAENLLKLSGMETYGLGVGIPDKNITLKIIDIVDGPISDIGMQEFELMGKSDLEVGEIVVSGDHVLNKYFSLDNDRKNEIFLRNKIKVNDQIWHRTGDSGYLKNGALFLTGRCKQLILRENKFLSPFVVEGRLVEIPEVSMGTILDKNGRLVLVVESNETKENIQEKFKDYDYDDLRVLNAIPRDPRHNSKIDYDKLTNLI